MLTLEADGMFKEMRGREAELTGVSLGFAVDPQLL